MAHGNLKSNKKFVCDKSKTVAMEIYSAIKAVEKRAADGLIGIPERNL